MVQAFGDYPQFYVTPYSQNVFPFVQRTQPEASFFQQQSLGYQNPFLSFPQTYHAVPTFHHFVQPQPQFLDYTPARANTRGSFGRSVDFPQVEPNNPEYGFGYRTQFDDGSSSMVVFVTGPQSQKLNFGRNIPARNLASEILENRNDDQNKKIGNALSNNISGLQFDSLIEAFPVFKALEEPKSSILHLYNHPANVLPLTTSSSTTTTSTTTESTTETSNDSDSIEINSAESRNAKQSEEISVKEAESKIQETKLRIQKIQSRNSEGTTQTSTSTSISTSTTTETSTESSEQTGTTTQN